ncbi:MAG: haloacid dehalogenase type II [Bacteroidota bacterium]
MEAIIVFDAYGTLFNLDRQLLAETPNVPVDKILAYTRQKQLEYTWLLSPMGRYMTFEELTKMVLADACSRFGDFGHLAKPLAALYLQPNCFEDVIPCLQALQAREIKAGILSNGSVDMLQKGILKNGLKPYLSFVQSADAVAIFKPHAKVYQMVVDASGLPKNAIQFVSSNQWDIAGAATYGFNCYWVNRSGQKAEAILDLVAYEEVKSLMDIVALI